MSEASRNNRARATETNARGGLRLNLDPDRIRRLAEEYEADDTIPQLTRRQAEAVVRLLARSDDDGSAYSSPAAG